MENKKSVVELRLCGGTAPNPGMVIDAAPLRWAYPAADNKRRRGEADDHQRGKRRKVKKNKDGGNEGEELVPTLGLLRGIESRGGREPVFLFKKTLEKSDVEAHHNRLMVTERERVLGFLTEEETAAVESGGLGIVGVDDIGNVYHELVLKKWPSMDAIVVNSVDWKKVVLNNKGVKGDVLEIWGFRDQNHMACFAFYFRVRLNLTL